MEPDKTEQDVLVHIVEYGTHDYNSAKLLAEGLASLAVKKYGWEEYQVSVEALFYPKRLKLMVGCEDTSSTTYHLLECDKVFRLPFTHTEEDICVSSSWETDFYQCRDVIPNRHLYSEYPSKEDWFNLLEQDVTAGPNLLTIKAIKKTSLGSAVTKIRNQAVKATRKLPNAKAHTKSYLLAYPDKSMLLVKNSVTGWITYSFRMPPIISTHDALSVLSEKSKHVCP